MGGVCIKAANAKGGVGGSKVPTSNSEAKPHKFCNLLISIAFKHSLNKLDLFLHY